MLSAHTCTCVCLCVCRSVGFAPVTVDSLGGMSITHTVQLSANYKENKIEGGEGGGVAALFEI